MSTLSKQYNFSLVLVLLICLTLLFGHRLFSLSIYFQQIEREHLHLANKLDKQLSIANVLGKPLNKQQILTQVQRINFIPVSGLKQITEIEKAILILLGHGDFIAIATKDIEDTQAILDYLSSQPNLIEKTSSVSELLSNTNTITQNSNNFKPALERTISFIETTVTLMTLLSCLSILFIFYTLKKKTIPPLKALAKHTEEIAKGDLRHALTSSNSNEIGALIQSIETMRSGTANIIHQIQASAVKISAGAENINTITRHSFRETSRLNDEAQMVTSTMGDLKLTIESNTKHTSDTSNMAEEGTNFATRGQSTVDNLIRQIQLVTDNTNSVQDAIDSVCDTSRNISAITEIITDVTNQTNLLALNAAIEAARAGDYGRGFTVVSDEVRALARKTQESANQIDNMIVDLNNNVGRVLEVMQATMKSTDSAVLLASDAKKSLEVIVESIRVVSDMNIQIASASEEQSLVVKEINQNTNTISDITDVTCRRTKEISNFSDEFVTYSTELKELTDKFLV